MTNNPLDDIADYADELTDPRRDVVTVDTWDHNRNLKRRRRIITLPSLLDQLATAVIPGEAYIENPSDGHSEYESKPAARLDAVDRLLAIQAGAVQWCRRAGLDVRDSADRNVRAMVGAAPAMSSDDQRAMRADLRAWRTWAATVTGWERPPDAPRAPCPLCAARGTLRVRLREETACCLGCGGAWDRDNIGLLAQHVVDHHAASEAEAKAARARAVEQRRARDGVRTGAA